MDVKQADLAKVLGFTPGGVSLAVSRGKLVTTSDGRIDLSIEKNYNWLCGACKRKGCEIDAVKNSLFQGIRLVTDNNKPDEATQVNDNNNENVLKLTKNNEGKFETEEDNYNRLSDKQMKVIAKKYEKSDSDYKHFRAKKEEEAYETARLANLEKRGELIKINPFGKFLVGIINSARSRLLNNVKAMAQTILDIVKGGVEDKKPDSEMIFEIAEFLRKQFENVFKACDDEMKSRVSQIKRDSRKYAGKDNNEN